MEPVQKKLNEIYVEQETIVLKDRQLLHKLLDFKDTSAQQELTINYSSLEELDFMERELEENHLVTLVQCVRLHNTELNHRQLVQLVLLDTIVSNIQTTQINILRCQVLTLEQPQDY